MTATGNSSILSQQCPCVEEAFLCFFVSLPLSLHLFFFFLFPFNFLFLRFSSFYSSFLLSLSSFFSSRLIFCFFAFLLLKTKGRVCVSIFGDQLTKAAFKMDVLDMQISKMRFLIALNLLTNCQFETLKSINYTLSHK